MKPADQPPDATGPPGSGPPVEDLDTGATVPWTVPEGATALRRLLTQLGLAPDSGPEQEGATPPLPEAAEPRYQLAGQIGQGGMGAVYEARDAFTRRQVALKVMRDDREVTADRLLRFVEEAQVTAQLEHPNIVPVHELGVDPQGRVYYTMKRLRGQTLEQVLEDLRRGDPTAGATYTRMHLLNLYLRVCDAVAFAHSRGVVHRDLKPANIMIGEFGEVLVLDWGLAKVLRSDAEDDRARTAPLDTVRQDEVHLDQGTRDGSLLGTIHFMAPEQASGQVDALRPACDIYALGAILYTIVCANPPFADGPQDKAVLLKRIAIGDYVSPRRARPDVPPALAAVIDKAMALTLEDRYAAVAQLQREVEAWQQGYATEAEKAGLARQLWLLVKRHRREFVSAALFLTLLAVIAVVAFLRVAQARREAEANLSVAQLNLQKFRDELEARRLLSRQAAPQFLQKAQRQMEARDWAGARQSLDIATGLDSSLGDAWMLLGQWYLRELDPSSAGSAFATAANTLSGPEAQTASRLSAICSSPIASSATAIRAVSTSCRELGELRLALWLEEIAVAIEQDEAARHAARIAWLHDACRELPLRLQEANPGSDEIKVTSQVTEYLELMDIWIAATEIRSIAPLAGLPINVLYISQGTFNNLTPIADAPLTRLEVNCDGSRRLDLSPLAGKSLDYLSVTNANVDDLTPLRGMPIENLKLGDNAITDLSPLEGMPLAYLGLRSNPLTVLEPLRGAPLRHAELNYTGIRSLDALESAPLTVLGIEGTAVQSLAPLAQACLTEIFIGKTPIEDLTALTGMPIVSIQASHSSVNNLQPLARAPLLLGAFRNCSIESLAPLAGRPLRHLDLVGCQQIADFRPLLECRNLERLAVDGWTPLVGVLRHHPSLAYLGVGLTAKLERTETLMPADEFWQQFEMQFPLGAREAPYPAYTSLTDRIEAARRDLEGQMQVARQVSVVFRDQLGLSLEISAEDAPALDLSCLAGLPLTKLKIQRIPVVDLSALQGMPLSDLDLGWTQVRDLTPLAGLPLQRLALPYTPIEDLATMPVLPLRELDLSGTRITDLSSLPLMPFLASLKLDGCRDLGDIRAVVRCPNLAQISLPKQAAGLESLQTLRFLRRTKIE